MEQPGGGGRQQPGGEPGWAPPGQPGQQSWGPPPQPPQQQWGPPPQYYAAPPEPAHSLTAPDGRNLHVAEWWPRVGAAGLDFLIRIAIVGVPVGLGAILHAASDTAGDIGIGVGALIGVILAIAYAPVLIARRGQTIGHGVTNTYIVNEDGTRVGGGKAFVREFVVKALLMENIAIFSLYLLTLLNYLWPLWDPKHQALHDKMCKTLVVTPAD